MWDTGTQLRKVRKKSNLTLDQLASISGIDRGTISRIELGHVSPRIDTISSLCEAMKTTLPEFFGHERNMPQAGPIPHTDVPIEPDAYWPVPATVWQGLVDVVERFEALLANSGEMVIAMNHAGRVVYFSPGGELLLGFKRPELMGTAVKDLVHEDDQPRFTAALSGPGPGAESARSYRLKCKGGSWRRFECILTDHLQSPSIHALILNAGMSQRSTFMDTAPEAFDRVMNLDFTAQVDLVRRSLPAMDARRCASGRARTRAGRRDRRRPRRWA